MSKYFLSAILLIMIYGCISKSDFPNKNSQSILFDIIQLEEKEESSLTQLFIKLPINKLVFNKANDGFISKITIDIYILDSNNKVAYGNSWNETITKDYYEDTKSKNQYIINYFIDLPMGQYKLNLSINDFENHITFLESGDFEITKNQEKGNISFFYKKGDKYEYYIESNESSDIDTLYIQYQIFKREIKDDSLKAMLTVEYFLENSLILKYNQEDKINYDNSIYIPVPLIQESFDRITIEASYRDDIINKSLSFEDRIKINYDFSKLVGPMEYIINMDEYNILRDLDSLSQINFLHDYWDFNHNKCDNKKMYLLKEFYTRVTYVNKNFSHFNNIGWSTDRGRIYIVHGKPKEIKNDFNQNGEFEIWYYDHKEFTFINKFGVYQLYKQYR